MLIVGSRLVVTDNSGAKEVQCIKTKGGFASIGDIITCSVKKAIKGKVEQASDLRIVNWREDL
jgi:large subunit ribosomal protein L14